MVGVVAVVEQTCPLLVLAVLELLVMMAVLVHALVETLLAAVAVAWVPQEKHHHLQTMVAME
jgi:hypothetical protein